MKSRVSSSLLALAIFALSSVDYAEAGGAPAGDPVVWPVGQLYLPSYGYVIVPPGEQVPGHDMVCGPKGHCYCPGWTYWMGSKNEKTALTALKWIVFSVCVLSLVFFGYEFATATCGWEETYVCIIELIHVCFSIWHMTDSPCMLYLSTGNTVLWLRYAEWLLSCPVILIHLSNLTGMKNDYNKRTMALLVSDVGCIVWGTTAAMGEDIPVKIIFYFIGLMFGSYTFYAASKIYIEAYHTVPKGICRNLVKYQAYDYFLTWSMFPILFMLGPEGFGHITQYTSGIAHEILDLFSKNLWGLLGHFIRERIHHHILVHGNITKKTKMSVGGEEVEVETYIDVDEANDPENSTDVVDHGTKDLANRNSFVTMRNRLEKNGVDVRASLGDHDDAMGKGVSDTRLEPGRVILVVPENSLVTFFQEQFALMPAPIEVVPALGAEVGLQLAQQAVSIGGPGYVDYVLMHPEFLRDRSPSGLLGRLKMMGMRVCAFGYVPMGPHRELIDASSVMLDGKVDGPSFQAGFDPTKLMQLTAQMQAAKKGGLGGMHHNNMTGGGMHNRGMMGSGGMSNGSMMGGGSMQGMNGGMQGSMMGGGGMNNGMGGNGMHNGSMMGGMQGMNNVGMNGSMGGGMMNNGAPAGLNNSMGNNLARNSLGGVPAPGVANPAAVAAPPSEAEMLTQLMGEINRLKSELGVEGK